MTFLRVTPQQYGDTMIRQSNLRAQNLLRIQRQISTGIRLEKPSDSPSAMAALLPSKANIQRLETDIENVVIARSKLNLSVSQLLTAKEAFTRAKILALDGVQSIEQEALAIELDGIIDLMMKIANTHDGLNPIFSGSSSAQPFEVTEFDQYGDAAAVSYFGVDQRSQVAIGKDAAVDVFYSGREIFQPKERGTTIYVGDTGAAAGDGTDTAVGMGQLTVRHTLTTFAGASGLAAGSSSVTGDTTIGVHDLTIDGTAMTISLDGGGEFSFNGTETDLRVVGPDGTEIYVDTTGYVIGFNGTIQVTGQGMISVDDGVTEIPIDFSTNQVLTDSNTGSYTNVNTSGLRRTGVNHVEYVGTADAFQALIQLRNELRNRRDLTGADWQAAMARRIGGIERIHDHLLTIISDQSASLQDLDAVQNRSENYQLEMVKVVEELESTDLVAAITQLQTEQNLLQYTFAASARLIEGTNLLDFLR